MSMNAKKLPALQADSSVPLYSQIREKLRAEIEQRVLEPGKQLPPESALMKRYEVSRITVRQRYVREFAECYSRDQSSRRFCRSHGAAGARDNEQGALAHRHKMQSSGRRKIGNRARKLRVGHPSGSLSG